MHLANIMLTYIFSKFSALNIQHIEQFVTYSFRPLFSFARIAPYIQLTMCPLVTPTNVANDLGLLCGLVDIGFSSIGRNLLFFFGTQGSYFREVR